MTKNVADLLVDVLGQAGVDRVYGLSGDSLNGITDSIRRREGFHWIHVRHEETAAFAAGAEAHLTGKLAACAGSCGPGKSPLDQRALRLPPNPCPGVGNRRTSSEIGSNYFQETHPEYLFGQCSHYCEFSQPEQMPRALEIAMKTAISKRGVSVNRPAG